MSSLRLAAMVCCCRDALLLIGFSVGSYCRCYYCSLRSTGTFAEQLAPAIRNGAWTIGTLLDQWLVVFASGTRMNRSPALVTVILYKKAQTHCMIHGFFVHNISNREIHIVWLQTTNDNYPQFTCKQVTLAQKNGANLPPQRWPWHSSHI